MYDCIIMCKSLTFAQRAERLFESRGCLSSITRAPAKLTGNSCGYGVKINRNCLNKAQALITQYQLPMGKAYAIENGEYREL